MKQSTRNERPLRFKSLHERSTRHQYHCRRWAYDHSFIRSPELYALLLPAEMSLTRVSKASKFPVKLPFAVTRGTDGPTVQPLCRYPSWWPIRSRSELGDPRNHPQIARLCSSCRYHRVPGANDWMFFWPCNQIIMLGGSCPLSVRMTGMLQDSPKEDIPRLLLGDLTNPFILDRRLLRSSFPLLANSHRVVHVL